MRENLSRDKVFRSSDLALIASLQLYGYQIEAMDRSNSGKIVFVIKRDDKLDKFIQDFWSRNLRVCPLTYFESLKSVKARIYQ